MKIENTLENKTLFFSKYLGQNVVGHNFDNCNFKLIEVSMLDCEVGLWGDWSGGTNPDLSCNDMIGIAPVWLNLKSINGIADEDLIKCYHLHSATIAYDYTQDFKRVLQMAKHWIENDGLESLLKYGATREYLQSTGYAVPYFYLSVKELLSYGWIRII